MKEIFQEFYINKNELNFRNLGKDVLIVFDTNILLDLYRASLKLREELMKSMTMVKDNVWMPYQVHCTYNGTMIVSVSLELNGI